jgi:hypothetical protein
MESAHSFLRNNHIYDTTYSGYLDIRVAVLVGRGFERPLRSLLLAVFIFNLMIFLIDYSRRQNEHRHC